MVVVLTAVVEATRAKVMVSDACTEQRILRPVTRDC